MAVILILYRGSHVHTPDAIHRGSRVPRLRIQRVGNRTWGTIAADIVVAPIITKQGSVCGPRPTDQATVPRARLRTTGAGSARWPYPRDPRRGHLPLRLNFGVVVRSDVPTDPIVRGAVCRLLIRIGSPNEVSIAATRENHHPIW